MAVTRVSRRSPTLILFSLFAIASALRCGDSSDRGDGPTGPSGPSTPIVASIEVAPAADTLVALGYTRTFQAVARDEAGAAIAGVEFVWSSSDPAVATIDPSSGVATAVGNGKATITATAAGVSGSSTLAVIQRVATVELSPDTASLSAIGSTQQFTATALDENGVAVEGAPFLWHSELPTVASVDPTGLVTARGPGTTTITASAHGVPAYAVTRVTQTAAGLAFRVQPANAVAGQAISPAVQVEIRDAAGNIIESATDAVTLELASNPGGGALSGTRTVNAVHGVASFSGLSIEKAAAGYTLRATAGLLPPATSAGFAVGPTAPARLALVTGPTDGVAGATLAPALEVAVQDRFGNTVPTASGPVTLALAAGPADASLLGTVTVSPTAGVARFSDLVIERAGSGYVLEATAGALAPATSPAFAIAPAAAARLAFTTQPSRTEGQEPISPSVRVAIQDAFGNTVPDATDPVTLTIGVNPGGGVLSGTGTVEAVGGVATFSDLRIERPGRGYTLQAAAGSLTGAESAAFDIVLTFVQHSVGAQHTCALTVRGRAYCWGSDEFGQIGNDQALETTLPTPVLGGHRFVGIGAGVRHTCGIADDDRVYCWGDNASGQLGDGTTDDSALPVMVEGGLTFASLALGESHTCGVTTLNFAYCWGRNAEGQLGTGDPAGADKPFPVQVTDSLRFTQLVAGSSHTCGIAADRAAYCWGSDGSGQLGNGAAPGDGAPSLVSGGHYYAWLAAGDEHSCGTTIENLAYCWGSDADGRLGSTPADPTAPAAVAGGHYFRVVAAGARHTCAIDIDAAGYCWGDGAAGQLGTGSSSGGSAPETVTEGLSFVSIDAGAEHTCGLTAAAELYCWGANAQGQLGIGSTTPSPSPVRVVH